MQELPLKAYLQRHLQPGDNVLDVGAGTGYFSLLAAKAVGPAGLVVALEPDLENFKLLEENLAANGAFNVHAFCWAAVEGPGPLRLYLSNTAAGSVVATHRPQYTFVEGHAADELLRMFEGVQFRLVKINAQGAELLALEGMQRLLETHQRLIIILNYYPHGLAEAGASGLDILAWLEKNKFKMWNVEDHLALLEPVARNGWPPGRPGNVSRRNLLCTRGE